MFSQKSAQIFTPVLRNTALVLATVSLAWTTTIASAQNSAQKAVPQKISPKVLGSSEPAQVNPANSSKKKPAQTSVLVATPKRVTDWWVPGILGGSVLLGGVGLVLVLKRSQQSLVTEAPEPIFYNPTDQTGKAIVSKSDLKAKAAAESKIKKNKGKASKNLTGEIPQPKASQLETETAIASEAEEPKIPEVKPEVRPEAKISEATTLELSKSENASIAHTTTRMPRVGIMDGLLQDLRSKDPEKRKKAIWELGRRGDSRAVQPLVDLLLDSDSQQRSLVLSALSEISTRTLKPMSRALAISMQDENSDVRKNAIRDLTRIYDTLNNISHLLETACEDSDPEVQETAKWAIGQINRIKSPLIQGTGRSVSQPESLS